MLGHHRHQAPQPGGADHRAALVDDEERPVAGHAGLGQLHRVARLHAQALALEEVAQLVHIDRIAFGLRDDDGTCSLAGRRIGEPDHRDVRDTGADREGPGDQRERTRGQPPRGSGPPPTQRALQAKPV